VTLAVKGILFPVGIFRRHEVPEFKEALIAVDMNVDMDIRWLIGRRTKPTFCVYCCI
jgi:hypothetical protein